MLSQTLQQIDPAQKLVYEKYLNNYLILLNKLKTNIVEYRLTLLSINEFSNIVGDKVMINKRYTVISDKGHDVSSKYYRDCTKEFQ
jgi:hypothetical protein